jgi:hypothetical protein
MYVIVQSDVKLASAFAGVQKFEARPGQIRQSRNTVPQADLASNKDLLTWTVQLIYFLLRRSG